MAKPIIMPQVGQGIETAVIIEWRIKEKDKVKKGDIVAIVDSDKASFEVEAFESGTVLKLLFQEGDEARVLEPIAYIGVPGEAPEPVIGKEARKTVQTGEREAVSLKEATENIAQRVKIFASPLARRIAGKYNIDLQHIAGSGPGGRIMKRDVMAVIPTGNGPKEEPAIAVQQPVAVPQVPVAEADQEFPFTRRRQKIAERLLVSKQTIPHFYLFRDVDMTVAQAWRTADNQTAQTKITVNDIIVKAVAAALVRFPRMNAHVSDNKLIQKHQINIGVAVSVESGLLVPVIENADQKEIQEISRIARVNAEGAQKGRLKAQSVGTFTISNLGMFDINCFLPIINPTTALPFAT
jgi:pyruvate dehydrogenase E2 component (dihydrolipoamide acetyltransferase)